MMNLNEVKILSENYCSQTSKENKLFNYLRTKIEATGPISVADYMKEALISPCSVSILCT